MTPSGMDAKAREVPFLLKCGLNFLQKCLQISSILAPNDRPSEDWVFVSLSIKNIHALSNASKFQDGQWLDFQVGLSILDCRTIRKKPEHQAVTSYNLVGTSKSYVHKAIQEFDFGKTEILLARNVASKITNIIFSYHKLNRKIALVGHGLKPYLRALRVLGLDIMGTFHACVDTHGIAQQLFDCVNRPKITELVDELGIKHPWLDNAGNYANYMTKALMALAALDWEDDLPKTRFLRARVLLIMSIADNLVVSTHSKMFLAYYRDLPKPEQKEERAKVRDSVAEKMMRIKRRQNKNWAPSWDEVVLCSRFYRWALLEDVCLSTYLRDCAQS
ncbi:hypothetical protein BKA65DRAFT_584433 [Rhexocercosporidium sp. MPI-PUGE-AT-0058]|nr:hypothetical protein BKA65DRAFT_584433 [Rhexocercosporidium sp. MPI-PUGE-AT-0058]